MLAGIVSRALPGQSILSCEFGARLRGMGSLRRVADRKKNPVVPRCHADSMLGTQGPVPDC